MSEKMVPIPYERLLEWVCREYETRGTIFGVDRIWRAGKKSLPLLGGRIETPLGPAAGPHTQLAQNLVAAYAAGARFFELKTVQEMDGPELAACVPRPCISAEDEGYNCEWSTELTVPQAMEEYIKAWRLLRVLSEKYGLGSPDGFVFNMSLGYTLEGIASPKITAFLDGMRDAGVSSSVTLSTLHGCPPDQIEHIANYLIGERGLHTYIKCNPTLLGYDFCRETLDGLGYDYLSFDERHFREDLQWDDAVPMFKRLRALARHMGVEFGLKLTNTFPVDVRRGELPAEEMYMSGRALFPLTAELAARAARAFEGNMRLSFAGGADIHSAEKLFAAGIWPITMATNLLRPGGYNRLAQLAERIYEAEYAPFSGVNVKRAESIAQDARTDPWYQKNAGPRPVQKREARVPLVDCFAAPCRDGCPIGQDIPAYLRMAAEGRQLDALRIITERNPLPNITGALCPHRCMDRCARRFYEGPVDIRACKLAAAGAAFDELVADIRVPARTGKRAAVVGAGPAGLAAAVFLAREGVNVTVFEKADSAGGAVRRAIPAFRVDDRIVDRDIALARAWGVNFCFGCEVKSADELAIFDWVIVCAGAWRPGRLYLEEGQAQDALDFLEEYKKRPRLIKLGKSVVVVGGGDVAMDAARAATRVRGVKSVTLVYRRGRHDMPADGAELAAALSEGVALREHLSPVSWEEGRLTCAVMEPAGPDASGRGVPVPTGERIELEADCVIAAVGQRVDTALYESLGLTLGEDGLPLLDPETGRSSDERFYLAGDGAGGPATIVEAIAGAARAAKAICGTSFEKYEPLNAADEPEAARAKKGVFEDEPGRAGACLGCAAVCEHCVDVCPNRANVSLEVGGRSQILHLDALCNRCGNCAVFCPWAGAPYEDKWTLFSDEESFADSRNPGFLPLSGLRVRARCGGEAFEAALDEGNGKLPAALADLTRAALAEYSAFILPVGEEETV